MLPGGIPSVCATAGQLVVPGPAMYDGLLWMSVREDGSPAQFCACFIQFFSGEMSSSLSQQLHNFPVPKTDRGHAKELKFVILLSADNHLIPFRGLTEIILFSVLMLIQF